MGINSRRRCGVKLGLCPLTRETQLRRRLAGLISKEGCCAGENGDCADAGEMPEFARVRNRWLPSPEWPQQNARREIRDVSDQAIKTRPSQNEEHVRGEDQ